MNAHILKKISRNLDILGIQNTFGNNNVVVENGGNDITIAYVDASVQSPMGGIDGNVTPFLGLGVVHPGKIKLTFAAGTGVTDIMDTELCYKVLGVCTAFGNNVVLFEGTTASQVAEIQGSVDLVGMGM